MGRDPWADRPARAETPNRKHRTAMKNFRLILAALAITPLTGCETWKGWIGRNDQDKHTGPLKSAQPDQFVTYLNGRAGRLQSLYYSDVRVSASDHSMPLPALSGSMAAAQPRNFRMTATGKLAGKVDLGSNYDQFWVYFDGTGPRPTYVFASHSDFESGKARLPGGLPFEPDWVMQALGMTALPPDNRYEVKIDDKARTYTLFWPAVMPSGASVVKEIVFDGDTATGTKPQVKKHLIRDTRGKVICYADIKQAKTVQLTQTDPHTGLPLTVQYPTLVVLRWDEQKFEMELDLRTAKVNEPPTDEQTRRLFSRPNIPGATPVDLARYDQK
jgi:hypothetical protein